MVEPNELTAGLGRLWFSSHTIHPEWSKSAKLLWDLWGSCENWSCTVFWFWETWLATALPRQLHCYLQTARDTYNGRAGL